MANRNVNAKILPKFALEASPTYAGRYTLVLKGDKHALFPNGITGSYGVLPSRLLGITYVEWLRYARDRLGAVLVGHGHKYVVPYFERNDATVQLTKALNRAVLAAVKEQELWLRVVE